MFSEEEISQMIRQLKVFNKQLREEIDQMFREDENNRLVAKATCIVNGMDNE